jgi:hypothetical protein
VLFPDQVIPADALAHAMVDVAVREGAEREQVVLENRDIRAMVQVQLKLWKAATNCAD